MSDPIDVLTVQELKDRGVGAGLTDNELQTLITAASGAMERVTHYVFAKRTFTDVVDGDGTETLLLPRRPVYALTQVTLNVDSTYSQIVLGSSYRVDLEAGLARRKDSAYDVPARFPIGWRNIEIVADYGADPVPEEFKRACCMLVQWLTTFRKRGLGYTSESIDGYSYSLAGDSENWPTAIWLILQTVKDVIV